jgi:hypothetical protein
MGRASDSLVDHINGDTLIIAAAIYRSPRSRNGMKNRRQWPAPSIATELVTAGTRVSGSMASDTISGVRDKAVAESAQEKQEEAGSPQPMAVDPGSARNVLFRVVRQWCKYGPIAMESSWPVLARTAR